MYTIEKNGENTYKAQIKITPQEWDRYVEEAYNSSKAKYQVQGFRKGKAPRKVIEQTYGNNVFFDDAIEIAFSKEYYELLSKEKDVQPISDPNISLKSFDEKGIVIDVEIDSVPEVKLGKYKGLEIEKHFHELDEEKVEKELKQMQERRARFVACENPAQMGNVVTIDFVGSIDGVEFEGGKAENERLELGSHMFIDTFEQQIVGMKIGEKRDINVKFPDNYQAENLKGKQALFKVTLVKVEEKQLPELNDEFASSVSEFETLKDYKDDIRKNLQASLLEHLKRENENNLLEEIVSQSEVNVPQVLIDRQLDLFMRDFEMRLSYQGVKLDDYLKWQNTTVEKLKAEKLDQAKQTVKTRLVVEKIIDIENLYVSNEELEKKIKEFADKYKKSVEDYKKSLGEKQMQYMENELLMEKVFKFLMENNTFVPSKHE